MIILDYAITAFGDIASALTFAAIWFFGVVLCVIVACEARQASKSRERSKGGGRSWL